MDRYDVVVVGAGPAGCAVSARLAEDPRRSVLLVEAGPAAEVTEPDPFLALSEPGRTWDGWQARRVPGGPLEPYPQGRGAGGSSAVNGLVAAWPSSRELAGWGPGWTAADLAAARRWVAGVVTLRAAPPGPVGRALGEAAAAHGLAVEAPLLTGDGSRRVTASAACLRASAVSRRYDAAVDRVLIEGGRAVGVRLDDGTEIGAGEVVLSAGAIGTPLVLWRSGVDHPAIGRHLLDHPATRAKLRLRGPAAGFPFSLVAHGDGFDLVSLEHTPEPGVGGVLLVLTDSRSVGFVTPGETPGVELRQLTDAGDAARFAAGVAVLTAVVDDPAIAAIASAVTVDGRLGDVFHAAGTCRLGDADDPDAVVDRRARVIGVDGLRIADASVMPTLAAAYPQLTCMMIGARVAEFIAPE